MDPIIFEILKTILLLIVFLFLSFFIFYLPGSLLVRKVNEKFRADEQILLSFSLGIILCLLISFLFSLLRIRILIPFIYLGTSIYCLVKFKKDALSPLFKLCKEKLLMVFLLFGTLVEGFINFPSGFTYKTGQLFWSSQGHDGLWHIAVIEAMKQSFPFQNPLYAGESLYNYHYFADIVIAQFNLIFPFFSSLDLYFRFFSFLVAFFMGLAAYSFLTTWTKNKNVGYLGIFFTYLVGSFGFLVLLVQQRGFFGGETIFWAAQGNTIIGNMPHAFNYFFIPAFFLAFYYFSKSSDEDPAKPLSFWRSGNNRWLFLICFLLGGFLVGFKVSAGAVLLVGLGFASLFSIISKENQKIIFLTVVLGLSNLISFKAITKSGESLIMFLPWWFIRTMIVVPDRVNWMDLELRRQFYIAQGGVRGTLRVLEYETIAFFIFLIGNLGMRVVGFFEIAKSIWQKTIFKDYLVATMFFTMLTGFIIPIFFIQKGVTYNLIQFMQYFLLIFGFFAAVSLNQFLHFLKRRPLQIMALAIFIFLSVPTVIGNLVDFYGKNPLVVVSNSELEALSFLKNNSNQKDIILTKPYNPYSHGLYKSQPWPIYAWDSTAYVSAYTTRQTYYTDEGQMRILGIPGTEKRLEKSHAFFASRPAYDSEGRFLRYEDTTEIPDQLRINFLKSEKINYLYLRQEEVKEADQKFFEIIGLKKIFENSEVVIYSVQLDILKQDSQKD